MFVWWADKSRKGGKKKKIVESWNVLHVRFCCCIALLLLYFVGGDDL